MQRPKPIKNKFFFSMFFLQCCHRSTRSHMSGAAHAQMDDISGNPTFTFIFLLFFDLVWTLFFFPSVIYSMMKGFQAWEQICSPAVPLTTSDTQARITTFSPATSPWLLWVRNHDTKNFSSPMKVSLCTRRGNRGKKKTSSPFSSAL